MNISVIPPDLDPPSLFLLRLPGVLGVAAFITNLSIWGIFLHEKRLRRSSALLIGLIWVHVLNGMAHSIMAFWPMEIGPMVTKGYCMKVGWPILYVSVYQLLPLVLALNAFERLLAFAVPAWYHNTCTRGRLWSITGGLFGIGLLIVGLNIIKLSMVTHDPVPSNCYLVKVYGEKYMCYGVHIPAILGGLLAVTCTGISVQLGRNRIAKFRSCKIRKIGRIKKEIRLTKCLLVINVMDVIFVVIPNGILLLFNLGILKVPLKITLYPVIVYSSDSLWNVIAFLLYNKRFRREVMRIVLFWRT